ncbi:MAG: hypothetical protein K2O45_18850 [Oscillospiraceae bacterium]|nr:hypothetical protein [Oscillospiraceae bacterium]
MNKIPDHFQEMIRRAEQMPLHENTSKVLSPDLLVKYPVAMHRILQKGVGI